MKKVKKETDEKKYFYYVRDTKNRPVITVCLIVGERGIGRGVSVCSVNDNPEKVIGRDISNRRALKAYWEQETSNDIYSENSKAVCASIKNGLMWLERYKIQFDPTLTVRELRMLKLVDPISSTT